MEPEMQGAAWWGRQSWGGAHWQVPEGKDACSPQKLEEVGSPPQVFRGSRALPAPGQQSCGLQDPREWASVISSSPVHGHLFQGPRECYPLIHKLEEKNN